MPNSFPRASSRSRRAPAIGLIAFLSLWVASVPIAAAADGLELTTDYPAVSVAPGTTVSFSLRVSSDRQGRVDLEVGGVPTGWTATLHGGGYVVQGVTVQPDKETPVRLDVKIPAAADGSHRLTVRATEGERSAVLEVDLLVAATAAGDVTMKSDFPNLRGPSDATYRYGLQLRNDTPEDLTFSVSAAGPSGWQVDARVTSQQQAASATVRSGGSISLEVTARPPANVRAGTYPIVVEAVGTSRSVQAELSVEITGTFAMRLTTSDERLNARASAGAATEQQIRVYNDGSAPLAGIRLSSSQPTGWSVTWDSDTIEAIPPGEYRQVTARVTPSADAIAGDYLITLRANGEQVSASAQVRVTVETSLTWGLVGAGLIGGVFVALGLVFRRYGRR